MLRETLVATAPAIDFDAFAGTDKAGTVAGVAGACGVIPCT
jgi:hypothetical protein